MGRLGERVLGATFGEPSGVLGRLGGRLMARGNAATERHLVNLAAVTAREVVLVVGPGPGVGLDAAGRCAQQVIGVDPSAVMRQAAARRGADPAGPGADRRGRPAVVAAGFVQVDSWTWDPPGPGAATAVQLRAHRPAAWTRKCQLFAS